MEAGESVCNRRVRSMSSSLSDSDLSDGWNVVEHSDAPSSDGESIEVIDNESADPDGGGRGGGGGEASLVPGRRVRVLPRPPYTVARAGPRYDESGSSLYWLLFSAAAAILLSNLLSMVSQNVIAWKSSESLRTPQPAFLNDIPVTTKPIRDELPSRTLWSLNGRTKDRSPNEKVLKKHAESAKETLNVNKESIINSNKDHQKSPLKINDHEVGKYLRDLSGMPVSKQAQNKFSQTLLILDALQIGLNDLGDVVTESLELQVVLEKQKATLASVVVEIEAGLLRVVERVATNVLDKVQKLERSFESQWCSLERGGYKDELKGLFYDCDENEDKSYKYDDNNQFDEKRNGKVKDSFQYEADRDSAGKDYNRRDETENSEYFNHVKKEKSTKSNVEHKHANLKNTNSDDSFRNGDAVKFGKKNEKYKDENDEKSAKFEELEHTHSKLDNGQFEKRSVDHKTSGSKHLKANINEEQLGNEKIPNLKHNQNEKPKRYKEQEPISEYLDYKGKNNKSEDVRHTNKNINKIVKSEKLYKRSKSEKHKNSNDLENNQKEFYENESNNEDNIHDAKLNQDKDTDKRQKHPSQGSRYQKHDQETKQEQPNYLKATAAKVSKYLKEKCEKNKKNTNDLYQKLKESVKSKVKIPIDIFNNIFNKYCLSNKEKKNQKEEHTKIPLKGENKRNRYDRSRFSRDEPVETRHPDDFLNVEPVSSKEKNSFPARKEENIGLQEKSLRWTVDQESPNSNNDSNFEEDWFIKAGEYRSQSRWLQGRGDWWFDRSSHRRGTVHHAPWLSSRRRNWFFRRAWAREQLRQPVST